MTTWNFKNAVGDELTVTQLDNGLKYTFEQIAASIESTFT